MDGARKTGNRGMYPLTLLCSARCFTFELPSSEMYLILLAAASSFRTANFGQAGTSTKLITLHNGSVRNDSIPD